MRVVQLQYCGRMVHRWWGWSRYTSHASCLPNECNVIDLITKKHLRRPREAVVKFSQSCLVSHYLLHSYIIRKWKTCNSVLSSRCVVSKQHTGDECDPSCSGKKFAFLLPGAELWMLFFFFHGRLKQTNCRPLSQTNALLDRRGWLNVMEPKWSEVRLW